ncbi:MAG: hypothetical protein GKS01_05740 [Alphaproteobacteria bacterium]|nr:hypothetical protein [Alphaproteobacteria bacterium]
MRIAIIGTGSIGRRHIGNLLKLGVQDIVAVSEHNRRSDLKIDGSDIAISHDFNTTLEEGVDAVFICNPTSMHLSYVKTALRAGVHIFLEKPAATSANGVEEMVQLANDHNTIIAVGHQYRFNKMLNAFRSKVDDGLLGSLLSVEGNLGEHIADYHPEEDYRQSYAARADLGGGVLLTQIHQIDYLNWIFGPFDSVYAIGGKCSALNIDVEASVSYLLRTHSCVPVFGHLDYLQRPKRVTLSATGDKGRLDWDYFANRLTFTPASLDATPVIEETIFDRNAMFLDLTQDFLTAITTGGLPRSTLRDGLTALQIVDAIKTSFQKNLVVEL